MNKRHKAGTYLKHKTSEQELKLMLILIPVATLLFGFGVGLVTGYQVLGSPQFLLGVIAVATLPAIGTFCWVIFHYLKKAGISRMGA
ncbi:hypothetical protein IT774_09435 [Salinimonas marina]|uniref:Uncharacterized protein n=1 Tax=Salinimonas marina TaxID=2785918 RepID=A0A7S9HC44_9ALTE|nr:hypothetical protein [Salinimonas marina]QPG04477.1 hypothetical protein IT774_09435 [Salinimonas marina]